MALDPRIEAIREQYDLAKDDFWQIPQNKQWVCKHAALEIVAAKAGIRFDLPTIIEAYSQNGVVALVTGAKMGDRYEWATGEASPKNCKNAYPWAMAEKRAKDRVILKLVGIHGLVYSEDELSPQEPNGASQVPASEANDDAPTTPKKDARAMYAEMQAEIDACTSLDDLVMLWGSKAFQTELKRQPADWQLQLTERKDQLKAELQQRAA
jgi:hypothetical protein